MILEFKESLIFELNDIVRIRTNVPAKELTTFTLGGNLPLVLEPRSIKGLQAAILFLEEQKIPWKIIGAGSNILLPDSPLEEVLLHLGREFSQSLCISEEKVTAASLQNMFSSAATLQYEIESSLSLNLVTNEKVGVLAFGAVSLMGLSRRLSSLGLSGLEFAAGIPASIGGAVAMNAGAHGSNIAEVVHKIFCVNSAGDFICLAHDQLDFSYRNSAVKKNMVIVAAHLQLQYGNKEEIQKRRSDCLAYRKKTQPLSFPSAGSVFKNPLFSPSGSSAGTLLEKLGLKGFCRGGVCFSPLHANWLIKTGSPATSEEASSLISLAEERVFDTFGVKLEPEILQW